MTDDDKNDIEDSYRVLSSSNKRTSHGNHRAGSCSWDNFSTAPRRGLRADQGSYSLSTKSHSMARSGSGGVEDILFDWMGDLCQNWGQTITIDMRRMRGWWGRLRYRLTLRYLFIVILTNAKTAMLGTRKSGRGRGGL